MPVYTIQIKRVYAPISPEDGWRILVDRLWPRGVKKEAAGVKDWCKAVAPSDTLRKWFGHEAGKWPQFQQKYKAELKQNKAALDTLAEAVKKHHSVTLVYAAKDADHNNAVVLRDILLSILQ